ncbi:MAG: cell division protein FtsZ [Alphaproteobacteria bacterium]|nr:cell division protein FtsZ [Alphaproteobacteria bacterium]
MTIKLSMPELRELKPAITVIGVGGAGGNAVNNMIKANLEGVEFVVANTDAQALSQSLTERRIQLGVDITHGLGAGSRPDIGRAAAEGDLAQIIEALQGVHMAFITAGMGGGTGTGAAPVIAQAAREQGILTVGVVTKPFQFEGAHRMRIADEGIDELQSYVDTLIIIPNQNLFRVANEKTTFADAFNMADDVLHAGVRGVTDLMVMPGLINLDFADVRAVMSEMGKAMMGTGDAEGEKRALDAAEAAISNPLLDDVSMRGARGVLINITGGLDMTLFEVDEAANRVRDEVDAEANIIFGSTFDESLEGHMRVSVVATGIDAEARAVQPRPQSGAMAIPSRNSADGGSPVALAAISGVAVEASAAAAEEPSLLGPQPPVAMAAGATAAAILPELSVATAPPAAPPAASKRAVRERPPATASVPERPAAERPFIAPRPMEPTSRGTALAKPDPFAEAAVANGPRAFGKRRAAPSLFERITRGRARPGDEEGEAETAPPATKPQPARAPEPGRAEEPETAPQPPAAPAAPAAPTAYAPDAPDAPEKDLVAPAPDDDLLDIPAFLRRQAN